MPRPSLPGLNTLSRLLRWLRHSKHTPYSRNRHRDTGIDVLEPRLLYSADHPFGTGILLTDIDIIVDDDSLNQEIQATLTTLGQMSPIQAAVLPDASGDTTTTDPVLSVDLPVHVPVEVTLGGHEASDDDNSTNTQAVATLTVTTFNDTVDAPDVSSATALLNNPGTDLAVSLREAVMAANQDDSVKHIQLSEGLYQLTLNEGGAGDDKNKGGDLDIDGHFAIHGAGVDKTIIEQTQQDNRVIELRGQSETTINQLTISKGQAYDKLHGRRLVYCRQRSSGAEHRTTHRQRRQRRRGSVRQRQSKSE